MSNRLRADWLGVYGAPILVGALSLGGLLSALLLGESGRYFAWAALAVPLAIAAWAYVRRAS
ncbi:hypothetical protein BH11PSE4_BH11PSE4_24000 [soil metagenome]